MEPPRDATIIYNHGHKSLEHPENYALLTHPVCTKYTQ